MDKVVVGGTKWHRLIVWWGEVGNSENAMLIGEYTHTLDPKKRLSLPAKFREHLGKRVVITRGLDNCLFMYRLDEWKKVLARLQTLSFTRSDTRGFNRFMLSGAVEVDVDSAGRILIPDFQKEFAKLKDKVVLAGLSERVEIWNEVTWRGYKRHIEKQADQLAEKLGEVGVL